jgi:hypothetical protein
MRQSGFAALEIVANSLFQNNFPRYSCTVSALRQRTIFAEAFRAGSV